MSKRVFKSMLPLRVIFASLFVVVAPKAAYAENMCEEGNSWDVVVNPGSGTYADGKITYATDSGVMTLNGYNGGPICVDDTSRNKLTVELEGENKINVGDGQYGVGVHGIEYVTVVGNGALVITGDNGKWRAMDVSFLSVENGNVRVLNPYNSECSLDINSITGGSVYSECMVFGGQEIFYQFGGDFEIKIDEATEPCFASAFMVFNGGTTNIECNGAPAMYGEYEAEFDDLMEQFTVETDGNIRWINLGEDEFPMIVPIPLHGSVLFNDGDITLKSDVASLIVSLGGASDVDAFFAEKGKDYLVMVADGMMVNSESPSVDSYLNRDENGAFSTLTDGADGTIISGSPWDGDLEVSANVLKTAHIAKLAVPDTDGEEVPETGDSKITIFAIMAVLGIVVESLLLSYIHVKNN